MKKIVVDMQNFLFADSIAAAFKNSNYDIDVVRAETPQDTVELAETEGFEPSSLKGHHDFEFYGLMAV